MPRNISVLLAGTPSKRDAPLPAQDTANQRANSTKHLRGQQDSRHVTPVHADAAGTRSQQLSGSAASSYMLGYTTSTQDGPVRGSSNGQATTQYPVIDATGESTAQAAHGAAGLRFSSIGAAAAHAARAAAGSDHGSGSRMVRPQTPTKPAVPWQNSRNWTLVTRPYQSDSGVGVQSPGTLAAAAPAAIMPSAPAASLLVGSYVHHAATDADMHSHSQYWPSPMLSDPQPHTQQQLHSAAAFQNQEPQQSPILSTPPRSIPAPASIRAPSSTGSSPFPPAPAVRLPGSQLFRPQAGPGPQPGNVRPSGPVPALRVRLSKVALMLFVVYVAAVLAYLAVRLADIFRLIPDWGVRGYSLAVLVVEVFGISALMPYAFANIRCVLPVKEDPPANSDKKPKPALTEVEFAESWRKFGCSTGFDIFVIIPCYKEDWSTIKRTLMCAMFARIPPGCRKHVILGNDGHDVPLVLDWWQSYRQTWSSLLRQGNTVRCLVLPVSKPEIGVIDKSGPSYVNPSAPCWWYDWWFDIHVTARPKSRQDGQEVPQDLTGSDERIPGNGKSLNLNYCIKSQIPKILAKYQPHVSGDPSDPKPGDFSQEVLQHSIVVVLDCDMAIKNDSNEYLESRKPPRNGDGLGFFPKILRIFEDPQVDLVLTPQTFTNVTPDADVFNHLNPQFWEYMLPGLTALGYVACTGTNMGLRLSMLHKHSPSNDRDASAGNKQVIKPFAKGQGPRSAVFEAAVQGPFPTYSVTEDYALSLELKKAGFKGTYHAEYLVHGEAPHGISKVDIQRGRWTEGHWQIFFSRRNPWFYPRQLGFTCMLYYNYGTLAYLCNILTVWVYQFVPLLSALGIQPVAFSEQFRVTATVYLLVTVAVQYYAREASHFFGMWRANMSNVLLSWTYTKAITRACFHMKSSFATHTAASDVPAHETQAQPEVPEPPPESLVQERVPEVLGHLLYFSALGLLSATTVLICIIQTIRAQRVQSKYLLPASWAVYNAVGPLLFFLSAGMKRRKSLEMSVELLRTVHNVMGLTALVSMWFVNSRLTIGLSADLGQNA